MQRICTLVFLRRGRRVFLAKKKRSLKKGPKRKVGVGCYNAFGGDVEGHELTLEVAAVREVWEESGVKVAVADLGNPVAQVDFYEEGELISECYIYLCEKWQGEPRETDEMEKGEWFHVDHLPFDEMMPGDRKWMPFVLEGQQFYGQVHYDKGKVNAEFKVIRLLQ